MCERGRQIQSTQEIPGGFHPYAAPITSRKVVTNGTAASMMEFPPNPKMNIKTAIEKRSEKLGLPLWILVHLACYTKGRSKSVR